MNFRFLMICLLFFSSCQLFLSYELVIIDFPEIESSQIRSMLQSWQITFRNEFNETIQMQYPAQTEFVEVLLKKGQITPIILTACLSSANSETFNLKPAGYLYPYEYDINEESQFLWTRGFLSQLLIETQSEISLQNINIPRLLTVIEEKKNGGDAWNLDYQSLLEDLIYKEMSHYSIRLKRERTVHLDVEDCDWFSHSLEAGVLENCRFEDEYILYTGVNCYINREGIILEVHIEEDGSYEYIVY